MAIIRTIDGVPADWAPGSHPDNQGGGTVSVDPGGYLRSRSLSLTDEGGYRTNFSGSTLSLSLGTCVFTNGSTFVTGSGFDNFAVLANDYVKLTADADSFYVQISSITDASNLILSAPYAGPGGSGLGSISTFKPTTGTGASIVLGGGNCAISTGTISGSVTSLDRTVDYMPLTKQTGISITNRYAEQTIIIGFIHDSITPFYFARFRLSDTDATRIICESASNRSAVPSTSEIESTNVIIPNNLTTARSLRYRIEVLPDRLRFLIQGILVAEHYKSIPNAYATLLSSIRVTNNTTVGTSNTINIDYDGCQNFNNVITSNVNDQDPLPPTTNDMETLVDIMSAILGRLSLPDASSRTRVVIESPATLPVSIAGSVAVTIAATQAINVSQVNATTVATSLGTATAGTQRTVQAYEGMVLAPQQLMSLYANIVTS